MDMLVFGMREVEYVVINDNIVVRMKWEGSEARLCIEAPRDVIIERDRVYEKRCRDQGMEPKWRFDRLVKKRRRGPFKGETPPANE
jgi:sRNA-binding carbon storage regulator CsrA